MLIDVVNFKKNLLNFYKKNYMFFLLEHLCFSKYKKKNCLILYFNDLNYYYLKKNVFNFLESEDIYFEVLLIKYGKNFYSLHFFENFFLNQNFFENFFYCININLIKKINDTNLFLFIFILFINNFSKINVYNTSSCV